MGCDQEITNENAEEKNVLTRKTNKENNSKQKKVKKIIKWNKAISHQI